MSYTYLQKCFSCWCHYCGRWEDCDIGDGRYMGPCMACAGKDEPYMPRTTPVCQCRRRIPILNEADAVALAHEDCKRCQCGTCINWVDCLELGDGCATCEDGQCFKSKADAPCPRYARQQRERVYTRDERLQMRQEDVAAAQKCHCNQ